MSNSVKCIVRIQVYYSACLFVLECSRMEREKVFRNNTVQIVD